MSIVMNKPVTWRQLWAYLEPLGVTATTRPSGDVMYEIKLERNTDFGTYRYTLEVASAEAHGEGTPERGPVGDGLIQNREVFRISQDLRIEPPNFANMHDPMHKNGPGGPFDPDRDHHGPDHGIHSGPGEDHHGPGDGHHGPEDESK